MTLNKYLEVEYNYYIVKTAYFKNLIQEHLEKRGNWKEYKEDSQNQVTFLYLDNEE